MSAVKLRVRIKLLNHCSLTVREKYFMLTRFITWSSVHTWSLEERLVTLQCLLLSSFYPLCSAEIVDGVNSVWLLLCAKAYKLKPFLCIFNVVFRRVLWDLRCGTTVVWTAVVFVALWADNWRRHWSTRRWTVCGRVADRLRTGQLSTHHGRIADPLVRLSEPTTHWALWLSTHYSCRHPQAEGVYRILSPLVTGARWPQQWLVICSHSQKNEMFFDKHELDWFHFCLFFVTRWYRFHTVVKLWPVWTNIRLSFGLFS